MNTITAQDAMNGLLEYIRAATQNNQQFCVTSEEGNVILLPEETYQNILVTLEFLSTPGLMQNIDFNCRSDSYESLDCASHVTQGI